MRTLSAFLIVGLATACAAAGQAQGKKTYDKLCASCHGAEGRGNAEKAALLKIEPRLLDLSRPEAANLPRDSLRKILLEGKGKMPAYRKKLKANEVDPVLDFAISLARGKG